MLDNVLGKIKKMICIKNFGDADILIDTSEKLPDDITSKKCFNIYNLPYKKKVMVNDKYTSFLEKVLLAA